MKLIICYFLFWLILLSGCSYSEKKTVKKVDSIYSCTLAMDGTPAVCDSIADYSSVTMDTDSNFYIHGDTMVIIKMMWEIMAERQRKIDVADTIIRYWVLKQPHNLKAYKL